MVFCSMLVFVIWTELKLHEPMFIFICMMLINGMLGSTAFLPKLMTDLLFRSITVSFHSCLVQAFCVQTLSCIEILTFTVMAYDRYLAVDYPLRYPVLMTNRKALKYIVAFWICSLVFVCIAVVRASRLTLCDIKINNVCCETISFYQLVCIDNVMDNIIGGILFLLFVIPCLLVIMYSYIRTFLTCLKISKEAYRKAINTLVTHLMAFSIYMSVILLMVLRYRIPSGRVSEPVSLLVAVTGFIISITVNPIIYGLRMEALRSKCFGIVLKIHVMFRSAV
ncbi:olfactory receptor 51E1-like [Pelodytes ibericus]